MTVSMFDTVTPVALEGLHDFGALAGYLDGRFPDYRELVANFPELAAAGRVLSIDVFGHTAAHVLDIETGDAVPAMAPAWFRLAVAAGVHRPRFYANLSTMPEVIRALAGAGIARSEYRLWVANWTDFPHIPAGFDACQWTDHKDARNLDGSLCLDDFFDTPAKPAKKKKPADPNHYGRFIATPVATPWGKASELELVKRFDALRRRRILLRGADRAELETLAHRLGYLAQRIAWLEVNTPPHEWTDFAHRSWRYVQLALRSELSAPNLYLGRPAHRRAAR